MKYGFVRIASAVPETVVADCKHNIAGIEKLMREAEARKVRIMAFPEMCITSYTCADLLFQDALLDEAESCLQELAEATRDCDVTAIVGMPVRRGAALYNCAVVMHAATPSDRFDSAADRASIHGGDAQIIGVASLAQAAAAGAENSKNFVSKFGRAKSYGAQTIGTPDAGAMSMAYFFRGLAQDSSESN